jgi:ketosteroid isomerase-like protein
MTNVPSAPGAEAAAARLSEVAGIEALKMRYARLCDAGYDPDGLAELFTEDAVWDGSPLFPRVEGREAIREHFRGASARITWALHYTLCPDIALGEDGVSAEGTWYLWQPCTVASREGESLRYLAATYRDAYAKVDGRWLFSRVDIDGRWLDAAPPAGPVAPR